MRNNNHRQKFVESKLQIQKKLDDCNDVINKAMKISDRKTAITLLKNSLPGLINSIKSDLEKVDLCRE
ncbi:hypothetical protein ACTAZI_15595 [Legionella bozemanae]|uniref:hypothetical protein n=1 Tax=Legionella bozemanae TaxID=447 RepID=UPI003EEA9790